MSMWRDHIIWEGKKYDLLDFIELSEGIAARPTAFGMDGVAERLKLIDSGYITQFEVGSDVYTVFLEHTQRPGWFRLAFARLKPGGDRNDITPDNYTMSEQLPSQNVYSTFGNVLFVAAKMADIVGGVERIRFEGGYERLVSLYEALLRNKTFVNSLASLGFEVDSDMMRRYGRNVFVVKRKTGVKSGH